MTMNPSEVITVVGLTVMGNALINGLWFWHTREFKNSAVNVTALKRWMDSKKKKADRLVTIQQDTLYRICYLAEEMDKALAGMSEVYTKTNSRRKELFNLLREVNSQVPLKGQLGIRVEEALGQRSSLPVKHPPRQIIQPPEGSPEFMLSRARWEETERRGCIPGTIGASLCYSQLVEENWQPPEEGS